MKTKIIVLIVAVLVVGGIIWFKSSQPAEAPITPVPTPITNQPTTPAYTLAQVAEHNSAASCWTAVGDKVYDLTAWVSQHPGGQQAILSICGKDGTAPFTRIHGSSQKAQSTLASFAIGNLTK